MSQQRTGALGLTASQAAHALGVSIGTIRRWSDLGHLGSYRTPGGQRRFSEAHIREFIDSLQREAEAIQAARTAEGDASVEDAGTSGETARTSPVAQPADTPVARRRPTSERALGGARPTTGARR